MKKYRKEVVWSIVLFVVMTSVGLLYQNYMQKQQIAIFEEQTLKDNVSLLHTVINGLNRQSDTIFSIKINQAQVLRVMSEADAVKNRDALRKQLYDLLQPTYELLKDAGIRQLHFHLPGNISFLRFHKPKKYGDSLKGVRYSIDLVNKTKKVVRGFEEGRIFNGFRNVYPLFYAEKFVGTVEISFSIRAIAQILSREENSFHGLLIEKRLVNTKVWSENHKYYLPSALSAKYLWDKKALDTLYKTDEDAQKAKLRSVEKILSKKTVKMFSSEEDFLLPFAYENKNYIAIFHVLRNVAHEKVGYIVSFKESRFFKQLHRHREINLALMLGLNFFWALLLFLFLKKEHDIKEMLQTKSNYDPLTNLLNRRGFEIAYKALSQTHERGQRPFSLLFVDIDLFKKINDTYGHDVGDLVLKHLAELLRSALRSSDIVARWGGEEFVILLNDADVVKAKDVAEKLRLMIEENRHEELPHFTISVGVAQAQDNVAFEGVLKHADEALYRAKESGRNRVVVY